MAVGRPLDSRPCLQGGCNCRWRGSSQAAGGAGVSKGGRPPAVHRPRRGRMASGSWMTDRERGVRRSAGPRPRPPSPSQPANLSGFALTLASTKRITTHFQGFMPCDLRRKPRELPRFERPLDPAAALPHSRLPRVARVCCGGRVRARPSCQRAGAKMSDARC